MMRDRNRTPAGCGKLLALPPATIRAGIANLLIADIFRCSLAIIPVSPNTGILIATILRINHMDELIGT